MSPTDSVAVTRTTSAVMGWLLQLKFTYNAVMSGLRWSEVSENQNQFEDEPLCIHWKRAAQAAWCEIVKDMTHDERLAYYEEMNARAHASQAAAIAAKAAREAAQPEPVTSSR